MHFKFKGVSAHASSAPQLGRSALKGVELTDVGVNFMREHLKEDARIHSVITNGGGQPNVVPAVAESWYYIRANKHEDVADMFEWVSEIARGAAMMTRTQVGITVDDDTYEMLPNRPLAELMDRNLTDVGNVSWNVPHDAIEVTTYPYRVPIHSWQVTACSGMSIGQKGMMVAAKTLAATAIDLFKNPSIVEAAKRDFEERRKGHPLHQLTPPNRKPPIVPESQ